jgi:hypothetical protein
MRDTELFTLRGEAHHPWHLYAGVVLHDKEGKIAIVEDSNGTGILPRDTVATDDTLARLVHKIILGHVGVVPEVKLYLGLHTMPFDRYDGTKIEKTVLYFLASFEDPYHDQFAEETQRKGVAWLPFAEAHAFLASQPWGEEKMLERVRHL